MILQMSFIELKCVTNSIITSLYVNVLCTHSHKIIPASGLYDVNVQLRKCPDEMISDDNVSDHDEDNYMISYIQVFSCLFISISLVSYLSIL